MSADQTIFRGDTPEFVWTLVDANGNPFDLTNYSGHFMAKQSLDQIDGDAIFDKAVTVDSPATDGIARVTLAEGDTNTVSGRFISELQLVHTGGTVVTADQLNLIIKKDIRRATA